MTRKRDDGWPRCPRLAEALVTVLWAARNTQWHIGRALDRIGDAWDRHINAAAWAGDDEDEQR